MTTGCGLVIQVFFLFRIYADENGNPSAITMKIYL